MTKDEADHWSQIINMDAPDFEQNHRTLVKDLRTEIHDLREALQALVDCDIRCCSYDNSGADELWKANAQARLVLDKYPLTYVVP